MTPEIASVTPALPNSLTTISKLMVRKEGMHAVESAQSPNHLMILSRAYQNLQPRKDVCLPLRLTHSSDYASISECASSLQPQRKYADYFEGVLNSEELACFVHIHPSYRQTHEDASRRDIFSNPSNLQHLEASTADSNMQGELCRRGTIRLTIQFFKPLTLFSVNSSREP